MEIILKNFGMWKSGGVRVSLNEQNLYTHIMACLWTRDITRKTQKLELFPSPPQKHTHAHARTLLIFFMEIEFQLDNKNIPEGFSHIWKDVE